MRPLNKDLFPESKTMTMTMMMIPFRRRHGRTVENKMSEM